MSAERNSSLVFDLGFFVGFEFMKNFKKNCESAGL